MKIGDEELIYAIEGSRKVYEIPVYQRHYSWSKREWDRLIEDVNNISKYGSQTHFMGTIVYIDNTDKDDNYRIHTVIDGQQRLITFTLLLKALSNVMSNKSDNHFKSEIGHLESLLSDPLNSYSGYNYKVKPGVKDIQDYKNIFEVPDFVNKSSRIYNAFTHFNKTLNRLELNELKQFYSNVAKLKAVWIGIEENDGNPQSIFETINSSGVALTFPDLIRNYILLQENVNSQDNLYEGYWLPFEEELNGNLDSFIRSYLIMKKEVVFPKRDSYIVFKDFYNNERKKISSHLIIKEMRDYAKIYKNLNEGFNSRKGYDVFSIFGHLNYELSYPFIMRLVYETHETSTVSESDLLEIVDILSSYMFRKTVSSINLTGVFANWISTLYTKVTNDNNKIKNNFIKEITSLTGKRLKFVTDEEFSIALSNADVYTTNYRKYILEELESAQSKEKINFSNLTIDHIVPQKLNPEWEVRVAYDDETRTRYNNLLHTLGNLTLTGYNSEKGNKRIDIYKNSNLILNRKIDLTSFDLDSIEIRTNDLTKKALNIWRAPNLLINNDTKENKSKIIINIFDFTFEDFEEPPAKIHINERNYLIDNWKNLFEILVAEFADYFSDTKVRGNTSQQFSTIIEVLGSLDQTPDISLEF